MAPLAKQGFPIVTPRLVLRPWRLGDEASLAAQANNIAVAQNLREGFPHPYTLADAHAWVARHQTSRPTGHPNAAPAEDLALEMAGQVIGGMGITREGDEHGPLAEIGYWLGERYWGQGLATEALKGFLPYVEDTLGLAHQRACVFTTNPTSTRVLEKCGFVRQPGPTCPVVRMGQTRQCWIYHCR